MSDVIHRSIAEAMHAAIADGHGSALPAEVHFTTTDQGALASYLVSLRKGESRGAMQSRLRTIARILLQRETAEAQDVPWHLLNHSLCNGIRTVLAEMYAPATCNQALTAMRGVLRHAWLAGLMTHDAYERAAAFPPVKGSRAPRGRALTPAELRLLFDAAPAVSRERDRAMLGVLMFAGLRRAEVAGLDVSDYLRRDGLLRVVGKGNRERRIALPLTAMRLLDVYLNIRTHAAGPLFCRVNHVGHLSIRGMSPSAVWQIVRRLAHAADVDLTPHDFRRTYLSWMMDHSDISTAQQLAGHANIATTARYDRRGEHAMRASATKLDEFARTLV